MTHRKEAALILGAALLVRVAFLLLYRHSPFFTSPILDSAQHDALARVLATGDWSAGAPYFRPPLFPWALGVLYTFLGSGPWPGRLFNVLCGLITVGSVHAAAGALGFSRGGRIGAPLFVALFAPLLFLEGELLGEPLATALAAAGLALLCRVHAPDRTSALWPWATASVLWAAASLARAPLVLLPVGLLLLATMDPGPRVRRSLLVVLAAGLVWIPPAWIMARHDAGFRFPSTQGGINFYAGNHRGADGRSVRIDELLDTGWPEFESAALRAASRAQGRELTAPEASTYWGDRGLAYWKEDPLEAFGLTLKKGVYLVHGYESPSNRSLYEAGRDVPFLRILLLPVPGAYWPSGILLPLALLGCFAVFRERRYRPVVLYVALCLVPLVLFFVCSRFRLPALPGLVLLAVPGLNLLRRPGPARLVAGALYLLANLPWPGAVSSDPAREHLARAEALLNTGRNPEADREYRRVLAQDEQEVRALLGLAVLADRDHRYEEALELTAEAGVLRPGFWVTEEVRARILDRMGRTDEAVAHLGRAVTAFPEQPQLWGRLGLTREILGDHAGAATALEEAIRRGSRDAEIYNSAGRYRRMAGDIPSAARAFDRALALDPTHFKARFNRGILNAERGRRAEALADLEACLPLARTAEDTDRLRNALSRVRSLP